MHNVAQHLNDEDWDTDIQENGELGGTEDHSIADYWDATIRHWGQCYIKNYARLLRISSCLTKNI